jgi:hypothetical protein
LAPVFAKLAQRGHDVSPELLDAMSEDRNAWREQAAKVVAALPSPIPAPAPTADTRRSCGVG